MQDTIDLNLFHSLVPAATATSIVFDKLENQDVSNFNLIGFCDANNHIAVYNYNTEYLVLNMRNAVIYAPYSCKNFLFNYTALTSCIFDNFDTRYVTNMQDMFNKCISLTSLDLSSFDTQNVTSIYQCFMHCESLVELNITFSCINLYNIYQAFYHCYNLSGILDFSHCNTPNNISMQAVFGNCYLLERIILPATIINPASMYWTFKNCSRLTTIIANTIVSSSSEVFINCTSLVGGNGTPYSSAHINAEYARVDGENGLPGYFTAPAANNNK